MNGLKTIVSKEKLYAVGNGIKRGAQIIVPILGAFIFSETGKRTLDNIRYSGNVTYDDAVNAIVNSGMYSSDKTKLLELLKRDEQTEYYKAVISTVRSSLYSSDKVKVIARMSEVEPD